MSSFSTANFCCRNLITLLDLIGVFNPINVVQTFVQKSDCTRNAKYQIHKYKLIWVVNPIYGGKNRRGKCSMVAGYSFFSGKVNGYCKSRSMANFRNRWQLIQIKKKNYTPTIQKINGERKYFAHICRVFGVYLEVSSFIFVHCHVSSLFGHICPPFCLIIYTTPPPLSCLKWITVKQNQFCKIQIWM